jgi:ribosome maturation factor RimP
MEVKEQIAQWLQPQLDEKDAFLVDVKVLLGGKKLEVYVDTDKGIDILSCAELSRTIEKHLDGAGIVPENYTLDVSSPGMTNPLKVPRQYKKRIGRILEVWQNDGTFTEGILNEATDTNIVLEKVIKEKKKPKKNAPQPEPEIPAVYNIKHSDIKKALIQLNW